MKRTTLENMPIEEVQSQLEHSKMFFNNKIDTSEEECSSESFDKD